MAALTWCSPAHIYYHSFGVKGMSYEQCVKIVDCVQVGVAEEYGTKLRLYQDVMFPAAYGDSTREWAHLVLTKVIPSRGAPVKNSDYHQPLHGTMTKRSCSLYSNMRHLRLMCALRWARQVVRMQMHPLVEHVIICRLDPPLRHLPSILTWKGCCLSGPGLQMTTLHSA